MRKRYISTLHCTGLILHDWCSLWRRCGCHFLLTLIILQEFPTKDESSLFSNNTALHIPCYQSISKYHFNWSFAHWIWAIISLVQHFLSCAAKTSECLIKKIIGWFWHIYGLSFCHFSFHICFLIFSDIFIFRQR